MQSLQHGPNQASGPQAPDADGMWFDVCEGRDTTPVLEESVDASGAWHSQQWLNAFCVLVWTWRGLPFSSHRTVGCDFKHCRLLRGV